MPPLSMNELTTYRWSFEEDVLHFAQAGFKAIGVWREKLADYGEEKGAELLGEVGLKVSNLFWAGGFTGSDGRSFRESIEDAAEAIELASELRAGCLVVYSGTRNGHTRRHARRLVRDALGELVPVAAAHDVKLAVEPMHAGCAGGWTFLTDLEQTVELLAEIDNRHAAIAFDTYHLAQDDRAFDLLRSIVDRIAIVHLGDSKAPPEEEQNRCRLGDGNLPLSPLVRLLCAAGYEGFFDIVLMGEELETADYQELLLHSRRAFEQLLPA